MATTTTNIGLTKPATSESASILVINDNMDTIDTKMGAVGDTSLQSQVNTLNSKIANLIKTYNVNMDNTGSLAAGATKSVTKLISSFIDPGYSVIAVIPRYSGDDQFCFTNVYYNTTEIGVTVRNVSSTADSGAPSVYAIAVKS